MQTMNDGMDSLNVLMQLNWDRMLSAGTLLAALIAGAAFGQFVG